MMTDDSSPHNAFTVDLEEWFQGLTSTNPQVDQWPLFESRVVPATLRLLEILRTYRIQATFFVLGHVADHHPGLIEAVQRDGHEIAVHGYWHRYVSGLTSAEFSLELEQSIKAIMTITGQRPVGHRAPYFSINHTTPWVFDILQKYNFRYDSSIFPIRNGFYGYPGMPRFPYSALGSDLIEFPLSTVRLGGINWPMAGGFYLRMLPYPLVRWAIKRLNRQGQPAILYMHPWEMDLGQPYQRVTPRERVTHFGGRRSLEPKLHRLFSEFRFEPLRTMLEKKQNAQSESGYYDYHRINGRKTAALG
jgi:polysaccharide deacetylase family protein (PEP-CTERM system associated)